MVDEMSKLPRAETAVPREARLAAAQWWCDHQIHVDRLIAGLDDGDAAYPPSGSDRFHPELWRAPHWRWFDGVVNGVSKP